MAARKKSVFCLPLKPESGRASGKEVEVAKDGSSRVLVVEELVQEEMDARPERIERKVPDVFCEHEEGERNREGDVREGRL